MDNKWFSTKGTCVRQAPQQRRVRTFFRSSAGVLLVSGALMASGAGAFAGGTPVWHVSHSPKLRVPVAAGCPPTISGYDDVVNTYPGPPLVPEGPKGALICWYAGAKAPVGERTVLGAARADELGKAVRQLNLVPPSMTFHCPVDVGTTALIAFSYPKHSDVALWYHASGCQTLDNGRIGSSEGANPSFYKTFLSTIDSLSPPPKARP